MPLFQPGHPKWGGKKVGSLNLRTQQAIETFERFHCDPLEEQIKLFRSTQMALIRATPDERLEYRKLLTVMLSTLLRYSYPQLRSTEHTGRIDHVHTTAAELEQMSDAELQAYVVMLRHERLLDAEDG